MAGCEEQIQTFDLIGVYISGLLLVFSLILLGVVQFYERKQLRKRNGSLRNFVAFLCISALMKNGAIMDMAYARNINDGVAEQGTANIIIHANQGDKVSEC